MRAREISLGDWVSYKGTPYKISDDIDERRAKKFRPLRLSKDILRRSGWIHRNDAHESEIPFIREFISGRERWHPKDHPGVVLVYGNDKYFYLLVLDQMVPVVYVHELQRVLKMLGLDSDSIIAEYILP